MKKFFLLFALVFVTANVNVKAQEANFKHEVGLSAGWLSNSQWIDIFEDATKAIFGARYKNEKDYGSFSAEYFYHFKKWLGVGAIVAFGQTKKDICDTSTEIYEGKATNSYYTFMPAVKFDWLRKQHIGLYSKIGLGATIRKEKEDYVPEKNEYDYDNTEVHFNWQVSLIGFEAGGESLRGFAELGMGEQGVMVLGVRYKF